MTFSSASIKGPGFAETPAKPEKFDSLSHCTTPLRRESSDAFPCKGEANIQNNWEGGLNAGHAAVSQWEGGRPGREAGLPYPAIGRGDRPRASPSYRAERPVRRGFLRWR